MINYRRARLADHFILRIRTTRTTDRADNLALLDQWNAAPGRNHSVEREQIVEMHDVDTVLEDLGWATEGGGRPRLVLRNLNRGQHRAVHSLEGDQVATGIGHRYVHLPFPLLGLC